MSRQSQRRFALIVIGVMALIAVAQHLGWIAEPPPLLAPGIH
jgi:predicted nucleic acid-binding Zn ribbon protein